MQENDVRCLQCRKLICLPTNRLVQDSCGHKKCRTCLLDDAEKCKQCISTTECKELNQNRLDEVRIVPNHTAVIQCNGKAKYNYDNVLEELAQRNCDVSLIDDKDKSVVVDVTADDSILKQQNCPHNSNKLIGRISKKKNNMPSHIILKLDPVSYFCTICKKSFSNKYHVKYHQYCTGDNKPYKCEICKKEFILKMQLQVHMYKHDNIKPFKCSVCKKSFVEKSKLSRHMALHSSEKKYICQVCAKAFKSKESLRVHSLIHKDEKPFSCTVCATKFNNSSNLKKHLLTHSSEKAHMCDQCGKRFKLKWALSVHRKSHLRIRPYSCNLCSKTFVNLKDLQRHASVHSETKEYSCGICLTSFRRKDNLHRHMKNTHPGKKGKIIKNVLEAPELPKKPVVIDNPNAIKVITASPAISKSIAEAVVAPLQQHTAKSTDSRPSGSVINGPIKLAFKTPAFKSNYNIARDCDFLSSTQVSSSGPLEDPIDITNNLLSLESTSREATKTTVIVDETSLKPSLPVPQPSLAFHYATSFQSGKHGMIKNIKFKVPEQYTNLFKQNSNKNNVDDSADCHVNKEHQAYSENISGEEPVTNRSVIVNNSNVNQTSDMHWRRRTSQNLVLKTAL